MDTSSSRASDASKRETTLLRLVMLGRACVRTRRQALPSSRPAVAERTRASARFAVDGRIASCLEWFAGGRTSKHTKRRSAAGVARAWTRSRHRHGTRGPRRSGTLRRLRVPCMGTGGETERRDGEPSGRGPGPASRYSANRRGRQDTAPPDRPAGTRESFRSPLG
jgi:hypothetical protein